MIVTFFSDVFLTNPTEMFLTFGTRNMIASFDLLNGRGAVRTALIAVLAAKGPVFIPELITLVIIFEFLLANEAHLVSARCAHGCFVATKTARFLYCCFAVGRGTPQQVFV